MSHPSLSAHRFSALALAVSVALSLAACGGNNPGNESAAAASEAQTARAQAHPDHQEFEAVLVAPWLASNASAAREFSLRFDYPGQPSAQRVAWTLTLRRADGQALRQWQGEELLDGQALEQRVAWDGRDESGAVVDQGVYRVELDAVSQAVHAAADAAAPERHVQAWDIAVGNPPSAKLPSFRALPVGAAGTQSQIKSVAATGSLPYTVYYANLHSQTNDSDGGGALSSCSGAQNPQAGAYGPSTAYAYAKSAGLDALMASEHNHMYDGSTGTNSSGSASAAKSRYQSGLSTASSFTAANPGFLALYGMEWGVISNGGHLNIFNSTELFSWEYNSSNELYGDRYTAKSDYAALYTTMAGQGLIGQFNHPATTGQFIIGSTPLAYSANGDAVMALAEVLNSSAYSTNTTETETSLENFEPAFQILLERGYHVAPSSNQDNHCANWGKSYTNRTGVLIPTGTALSKTSFLAAIKARRVFATMDKTAQIMLTANNKAHLMGEQFSNTGALSLSVGYASTSGKTASTVQIYQGVPGRNGTVTLLASTGSVTTTPSAGKHFYYAKITQSDGKILWSAPIWVTQS